ncbi:MAG: hypothetical protein WCF20_08445 [Methylovirgula sp.]
MEKARDASNEQGGPSARYVTISLIALGAIDLFPKILFLSPWLFAGGVSFSGIIIMVGLVTLDIATINAGVAVSQQWRFYKIFGLITCAIGTLVDIVATMLLMRIMSDHLVTPYFLGDLAFHRRGTDTAFAYGFLMQTLSLAAHGPGHIYFWRWLRKSGMNTGLASAASAPHLKI